MADVNSFCRCDRFQFPSEAAADLLHMNAVLIASHPCAKNSLRQIVTDIQPEFAPDFFSDVFCDAVMQPRIFKKRLYCLYPLTLIRRSKFSENDSDRCLRIEIISIFLFVGGDFNQ